jgi:hypothetical protein
MFSSLTALGAFRTPLSRSIRTELLVLVHSPGTYRVVCPYRENVSTELFPSDGHCTVAYLHWDYLVMGLYVIVMSFRLSSGLCPHVVWYVTIVFGRNILPPEDVGGMYLQDICNHLTDYTVSEDRSATRESVN